MNKLLLLLPLISMLNSCLKSAGRYEWAEESALFDHVQWSFAQKDNIHTKRVKMKAQLKARNDVKNSASFTLYNNTEIEVHEMQAEFVNGALRLNEKKILSGEPFDVNGAKQLTFYFEPSVKAGIILIALYTYIEGFDKKPSIYEIELMDNLPPKAILKINRLSERRYQWDASGSVDADADRGGTIVGYTYAVIEIATGCMRRLDIPSTQKETTYEFHKAGEFRVQLTVIDSDDAEDSIAENIAVN